MATNIAHTGVIRIYGGMPSGDSAVLAAAADPGNQGVSETVAVGTVRRPFRSTKKGGHYSIHFLVDSAAGATSAATVWYSNIPDPSLASDADWVQDTTVGSIDLTVTGGKMFNIGNVYPEWVMIKVVVVTSTGNFRCFVRTEGTSVSGL